jgi:hypothetical protein
MLEMAPELTDLPNDSTFDLRKFADSDEGLALTAWVQEQYSRAKTARSNKQLQWYMNMAFFFGKHHVERMNGRLSEGFRDKLVTPKKPYYQQRRTINRIRATVRSEISRFVSQTPTILGVPASADDEDVRAAYAAEQAWRAIENAQKLKTHFGRATWWTVVTGNGFIKDWWDKGSVDRSSGEKGAIKFAAVTPFHLFVPDLREPEIEDEPFIIQAQVRPVSWCYQMFAKELEGRVLKPSISSTNQLLDDGHLNLSAGTAQKDSCVVFETWIKPGGHPKFPHGACIITIDDRLVRYYPEFPYEHGEYPFTKFEHIPSATFYADSPLVDLIPLQQDYNRISGQVIESAIRMGRPQLLVQKGSVAPAKMTNEIGQIIEYRAGSPAPVPLQPSQVPEFVLGQFEKILTDMEDISGQHDVTRGSAPPGVTAGTAINYLEQKDNQFLTPEYNSIEQGWERIASHSIQNFVQFVDLPRKIRTVGADEAFDTILLSGADLKNGTDVRVEPGSSVGESQAAKRAQIMEMWGAGLITDPNMALAMMEVGGEQRALDILNAAKRKAQRENIKFKMLTDDKILQFRQEQEMIQQQQMEAQQLQAMLEQMLAPPTDPFAAAQGVDNGMSMPGMDPSMDPGAGLDPTMDPGAGQMGPPPMGDPMQQQQQGMPGDPTASNAQSPFGPPGPPPIPPIIPVDSFDVHPEHLLDHNIFRMSQEYEMLTDLQKEEIDKHVKQHEALAMQGQLQQFLGQIPSDGTDGSPQTAPPQENPNAMLSGNGAASAPPEPTAGGQPNG